MGRSPRRADSAQCLPRDASYPTLLLLALSVLLGVLGADLRSPLPMLPITWVVVMVVKFVVAGVAKTTTTLGPSPEQRAAPSGGAAVTIETAALARRYWVPCVGTYGRGATRPSCSQSSHN
jgi:hypothetical protein